MSMEIIVYSDPDECRKQVRENIGDSFEAFQRRLAQRVKYRLVLDLNDVLYGDVEDLWDEYKAGDTIDEMIDHWVRKLDLNDVCSGDWGVKPEGPDIPC